MAKRQAPDWESIEREFRAGQKSIRMIAKAFGVSHVAISKKAADLGWERDLSKQVRDQVRVELLKDAVTGEVTKPVTTSNGREIVKAAGLVGADVIREHRKDISDGRNLIGLLFNQLKDAASNRDAIEAAIWEETAGDRTGDRRNAMMAAVSLPKHAGALRDLSTALKNLIPLERQAFNLDEPAQGDPSGLVDPEQVRRMAAEVLSDGDET